MCRRFTHVGESTFVSYGHRAADIMGSDSIRAQLRRLQNKVKREVELAKRQNP